MAPWTAAGTLTLLLLGASTPSPLYVIYRVIFGFSATGLTAISPRALAVLAAVSPVGEHRTSLAGDL